MLSKATAGSGVEVLNQLEHSTNTEILFCNVLPFIEIGFP